MKGTEEERRREKWSKMRPKQDRGKAGKGFSPHAMPETEPARGRGSTGILLMNPSNRRAAFRGPQAGEHPHLGERKRTNGKNKHAGRRKKRKNGAPSATAGSGERTSEKSQQSVEEGGGDERLSLLSLLKLSLSHP